jgi:peptide/nickel transport system ATP-binding protein
VIDDPQHPYTQLLLRSIPQPDPDVRWEGTVKSDRLALAE